jgi:catechol 2,3-dioxygenase-like lactoylglutathione lyase family enzyme
MPFALHHVAVQTSDFDRAYHFFHHFLGLDVVSEPQVFKTRRLCFLRAGAVEIELYSTKQTDCATPYSPTGLGPIHLAFSVDDLDSFLKRCHDHKVPIIKPPFELKSSDGAPTRLAFIEGPDGQEVEIRALPDPFPRNKT